MQRVREEIVLPGTTIGLWSNGEPVRLWEITPGLYICQGQPGSIVWVKGVADCVQTFGLTIAGFAGRQSQITTDSPEHTWGIHVGTIPRLPQPVILDIAISVADVRTIMLSPDAITDLLKHLSEDLLFTQIGHDVGVLIPNNVTYLHTIAATQLREEISAYLKSR